MRFYVGLTLCFLLTLDVEAFVGVSPQPFSVEEPQWIHVRSAHREPSAFWGVISKPYPTNYWFVNLVWSSYPVTVHPYILKPFENGVIACYPVLQASRWNFLSAWHDDIMFYSSQLANRTISDFTMLGVECDWAGKNGTSLTVPFVQGSPYVTIKYTGTVFNISVGSRITGINGVAPPTDGSMECFTGAQFILDLLNRSTKNVQKWVVWSLLGEVTLCYVPDGRIGDDGAYYPVLMGNTSQPQVTLRISLLVNTTDFPALDKYKSVIVTGGDVSIGPVVNDSQTSYSFTWKATDYLGNPYSGPDILMMGLPHHVDIVDRRSLIVVFTQGYYTSRGRMIGFAGSTWTLYEPLTRLTWYSPRPVDPTKIASIKYELIKDMVAPPLDNDTYGFGKYVGQLARLSLIAEEIGEFELQQKIRERLKFWMAPWLNRVTYRKTFLYDTTFGSSISADGWLNRDTDFGNGIFADHHFHYSYYIYAGAVILKDEPDWEWGPRLMDLVRDVANPSSADPFFPVTRHKDWYNSHSWAQGLEAAGDGKNQESTSEAVHCYYAVYLLGLATHNDYMKNFGRLLLATEVRGAQRYWQMKAQGSDIYPPAFSQNTMVGVLWSDKADYSTWFAVRNRDPAIRVEHIHCIQMLPFTPITEELLKYSFVVEEYKVLSGVVFAPGYDLVEEWKTYVYMDLAILDPVTAWAKAQYLNNAGFGKGNSRTNTYWWIATRPNMTTSD